jgi:HD-GYP domain-containing protein (c-di-GMP phosphodiesterase class II)/DNA-binding CsgD family transcriptional regulator
VGKIVRGPWGLGSGAVAGAAARPIGVGGVVAALSVTSDLTRGHPPGEAMRACLLATELARRAGLHEARVGDVYYATLLRFAGCAATSHEIATRLTGNDVLVRARGDLMDATRPLEVLSFLGGLGQGFGRLRTAARGAAAKQVFVEGTRADCEVGADLTRRLRLPDVVRQAVLHGFERYDGRGAPDGVAGEEIAEAARYAAVGFAAVMFDAYRGADQATATVRRWSGRALDPAIVAIFLAAPEELLRLSDPDDEWAAVVDAEPEPKRMFRDEGTLDEALAGFGDAADLKTPWFHGHSGGVARLAREAASSTGTAEPALVYRAGLLHDLGRVAVPTGIWEHPGALRRDEWELVRQHPYASGRILARSPVLAPLERIVSRHHERADGLGYPAGARGSELDAAACLLAAADVLHALTEPRPYRPALEPAEAARVLATLSLDRDAIRAVVDATGAPQPPMPHLPADLTERELDVLRLLASGRTKKEVATDLVISPATVHTHTVHIYAKCRVSTRAGLAMFAMQHGLAARPGAA